MTTIADVDAVKASKRIEQLVAFTVLDIDALAAGHDPVAKLTTSELGEMGRGVEEILAVPFRQLIILEHINLLIPRPGWAQQTIRDQPLRQNHDRHI